MIPAVPLLGLDFANLTAAAAAEAIDARPVGAPFQYVVTPNADHLVRISRDPALAPIYRNAWLRLLDSRVVSHLGLLFGMTMPPVAAGSDVTSSLLNSHIHKGETIAIIGLRPEWLPPLVARYGLEPPFHYYPPMGFDRDPAAFAATVSFILDHPVRLIFLAVGSPGQERLAGAVAATGRAVGTGLCVGASLAFLSGADRRAPAWIRRHGLEWAFRLAREPRRLARRYLIDSPMVLPLLLREFRKRRRPENAPGDDGKRKLPASVRGPSVPTPDVRAP